MPNEEIERFKMDIAKFSAHYEQFFVVVKTPGKQLMWKSSDTTWAVGAAQRYISCMDEVDRISEHGDMDDN